MDCGREGVFEVGVEEEKSSLSLPELITSKEDPDMVTLPLSRRTTKSAIGRHMETLWVTRMQVRSCIRGPIKAFSNIHFWV